MGIRIEVLFPKRADKEYHCPFDSSHAAAMLRGQEFWTADYADGADKGSDC